jgi:hypothetical protein
MDTRYRYARSRRTIPFLLQPRGLFGILYRYGVAPFHHIVFGGMRTGIHLKALQIAGDPQMAARELAASNPL